ncbi:MAG: hypothetical protein GXP37_02225 [Chloroflexi bacterium]|nr:hypothetical protein [Chloroflexota bacterium]
MSGSLRPNHAAELLLHLQRRQDFNHRAVESSGLSPQLAILRTWQSQRLATTHADLLASRRYGPACRFFLDDVYAPQDFSQRNTDIRRMHDFLMRFLPASVLHTLTQTIVLNELTEDLDARLLQALVEPLGMTDTITPQDYARAYRICDNYDQRQQQIDMIVEIGGGIERLARIPFIGWTLRRARGPALRGGWYELQGFLERGYAAFKHMGRAEAFLQTIHSREMQILDQIFAAAPHPFRV